jgi:hypothetical protein
MPSDWIEQDPHKLADQIETFVDAFDTPEKLVAGSVTAAQLAALTTHKTALRAKTTAKETLEAQYRAAVQEEKSVQALAEAELRAIGQQAQNSAAMTDTLRLAAGLNVRKQTSSGHAEIPRVDDLVALPRPSGHTFLDWSGPTGGGISYEVETRTKADSPWEKLDYTLKTAYTHTDAGAGVHREYRVVPKRSDRVGEPSNTASVY